MGNTTTVLEKAIADLRALIEEASRRGLPDANAAALATSGKSGRPSVRVVYVQSAETGGVVFFANSRSGKGKQLEENPRAAVCFFWPGMQYQVVLEGDVEMLSEADSTAYWQKCPREAQLGAWASEQTEPLHDRNQLKNQLAQFKKEFDFERAPRPDHWRAYRIHPNRIEFWPSGWHRLRARTKYQKQPDGEWTEQIENP